MAAKKTAATKTSLRTGGAKEVVEATGRLLADSYTLYLKTHNYHWNVTGPMFATLHTLFETQYTELAMAVDEIAERIRAQGALAPGSYTEFERLARVKEAKRVPRATEMVRELAADCVTVAKTANELVAAAQKAGDEASADLGIRRIQVAEKNAWMLRSLLQ